MIFNSDFERLFLRFKKLPGNKFSKNGLAGETAILNK